jgi:hypothetical protein
MRETVASGDDSRLGNATHSSRWGGPETNGARHSGLRTKRLGQEPMAVVMLRVSRAIVKASAKNHLTRGLIC